MKVCQGLQDFRGRWEYKFKKIHIHTMFHISGTLHLREEDKSNEEQNVVYTKDFKMLWI